MSQIGLKVAPPWGQRAEKKAKPLDVASIMARESAARKPGDSTSDEDCEQRPRQLLGLGGRILEGFRLFR
jgi:hypothetical protein